KGDNPDERAAALGDAGADGVSDREKAEAWLRAESRGVLDEELERASGVEPDGRVGGTERVTLDRIPDDAEEGDLHGNVAAIVPQNDREPGDRGEDSEVDGDTVVVEEDHSSGTVSAGPVLGNGKPQVISAAEFEGEDDETYSRITLTWYQGDDVLADDDGRPI